MKTGGEWSRLVYSYLLVKRSLAAQGTVHFDTYNKAVPYNHIFLFFFAYLLRPPVPPVEVVAVDYLLKIIFLLYKQDNAPRKFSQRLKCNCCIYI